MDKVAHHPDGSHVITFEEGPHVYTDNRGVRYTSGTAFIGKFFGKFDAVAISTKCAMGRNPKYAGRPPGEIREEWSAEARRGQDEGTNVHEYAEGLISGWPLCDLPPPISERCERIFIQTEKAVKNLLNRFVFVGAEVIIFSPDMGLAGMIDLLMFDRATNEILILDWKQNKAISTENPWQSGLPPIDHLQDTDIAHYSLQLSLYQAIMERENYFPVP